jgi:hypothetical protein
MKKLLSGLADVFLITSIVVMLDMGGINLQNNFALTIMIMLVVIGLAIKSYAEGINAGIGFFK